MTDKNIFLYNFILSLKISDFSYVTTATLPEKGYISLYHQPPLKSEILSSPPLLKIRKKAQPHSRNEGGGGGGVGHIMI